MRSAQRFTSRAEARRIRETMDCGTSPKRGPTCIANLGNQGRSRSRSGSYAAYFSNARTTHAKGRVHFRDQPRVLLPDQIPQQYVEARHVAHRVVLVDIFDVQLRVRGKNGSFQSVSVHEATATQLEEGIRLRQARREQRRRSARALRARAERVSQALPPPPKGIATRRVRLLEHPGGQVLASFFGIPLEHVGLLFKALKSELLSAPEVAPTPGRVPRGG